jgi:hypothetical protein
MNPRIFILLATTLFLLSACNRDPIGNAIIDQPVVKDSLFFNSLALDSAGRPVTQARVDLDIIQLGALEAAPAKARAVSTVITANIEIYDMFDENIQTIDTILAMCIEDVCNYNIPVWDGTDYKGNRVLPGLYYLVQSLAVDGVPQGPIRRWFMMRGPVDTTDAQGHFRIPPLPQEVLSIPVVNNKGEFISPGYYKGWIRLTFINDSAPSGPDTLGRDTVCVFGPRRSLVFHPH